MMISTLKYTCKGLLIKYVSYTSSLVVDMKYYTRLSHRKPLKILSQDQLSNINEENLTNVGEKSETNQKNVQEDYVPIRTKRTKLNQSNILKTSIDSNDNIVFTKTTINDPKISTLLTAVKSQKSKRKENLILLEGKRLIWEALENKCTLKYLLFSRKHDLEYLKPVLPTGSVIYKVLYREMQMWSDLTTCPSIMGIFEKPHVENNVVSNTLPITIICDNIREPGNLGSILRTAAGVGCQKVLLTKGCTNLWDTKVLRGASGAHFYLQILTKLTWQEIEDSINKLTKVYVADNVSCDKNKPEQENVETLPVLPYSVTNFNGSESVVLIIGGETEGISEEAYSFVKRYNGSRLNIPMNDKVDSLNSSVALGVIAFEIKNQLLKNQNVNK